MVSADSTTCSTLDIDKASDVASRRMGYERLFPKQREVVEAFVSGRDALVCLPAGGYIRKELLLGLPSHRLGLFEGSNLLDCCCCDAACGHHEEKSP